MIEIKIAGFGDLRLEYLVLDFNGTLAVDGRLTRGVRARLNALSNDIRIYILTADTFGRARKELKGINCELRILKGGRMDLQKENFVKKLGASHTVGIGNGRNDRRMLKRAALGVLVIGKEGYSADAMSNADVGVISIIDGLDLLLRPKRLVATLKLAG